LFQEKKWYIDQMLKVLSLAGSYVKDDVWHALIVAISNGPDLQGYSVRSLYKAFQTSFEQVKTNLSSLVERMPVLDEPAYMVKKANSSQENIVAGKSSQTSLAGTSVKLPNGVAKPPAAPLVDLLDLSSDDAPVPPSTSKDFLHDLLGIDLTNSSSSDNHIMTGIINVNYSFFHFRNPWPCVLGWFTKSTTKRSWNKDRLTISLLVYESSDCFSHPLLLQKECYLVLSFMCS
ncbi:hypothetical protein BHE74_00003946, partial [Ensete ventricosum]